MTQSLIFHATAPFSLFCDNGCVARPFWRFDDAEEMVAHHPDHSFRVFERQDDGSYRDIYFMPARLDARGL
jgi:hypothetical protein